jgi:Lipocalin-like domain
MWDRRFVGVWRLEAIRDRLPDGRVKDHPDFGPEPDGLLVYTDSGHVTVQFMRRGRTAWSDEDAPTDGERAEAARGYGAYAGRFEVDAEAGVVRHHVETALIPNRVGSTLERAFAFDRDRLTLSPRGLTRGAVGVERSLVWRRVSNLSSLRSEATKDLGF